MTIAEEHAIWRLNEDAMHKRHCAERESMSEREREIQSRCPHADIGTFYGAYGDEYMCRHCFKVMPAPVPKR